MIRVRLQARRISPGTTKLARLEENIGAVAVELTPDDLREIASAASEITVQGTRYPERLAQPLNDGHAEASRNAYHKPGYVVNDL